MAEQVRIIQDQRNGTEKDMLRNYGSIEDCRLYEEKEPQDRYHCAYILFCIIGFGMLLPWNFFINADNYFHSKLKQHPSEDHMFENAFTICSQIPCGFALIINLYLTERVSRHGRMLVTLIITSLCFILTAILVNINTKTWTEDFFGITLGSIVLINFCSGINQGTIFGIAGATGGRYVQGVVVGMSLGGTFASVAELVTLAAGSSITSSATAYFGIASAVIIICILSYILLFRLDFIKYHFKSDDDKRSMSSSSSSTSSNADTTKHIIEVIKLIYPMALSVMSVFAVSISLMPSILSGIRSVKASNGSPFTNKYFTGVVGFLLFNLGDFSGRVISGYFKIVGKRSPWLPLLCVARIVFIPLFILCNYQPRSYLPVIFDCDAYPIVFNLLFSLSNGYLASLTMMYGPELVPPKYMETAGAAMQLFLTIGLAIGAILSFAIVQII